MNDEERLRERLRRQVNDVPVVSDLDDVAARLGRRNHGRNRRVASLLVVGLMLGSVGGYVVGRAVRDDTSTVTVGGAPEPTAVASTTPTTVATVTTCVADDVLQTRGKDAVPCDGTPPSLPAPGADQPADPAAARRDVTRTYADAYDGDASNQRHMDAVEGGSALAGVFDELRSGPFGQEVRSAQTVVEGIVFLSPTQAAVKFHSELGGGSTSGPYFGDAILTPAGWQISHASFCQIIIPAGVHCP